MVLRRDHWGKYSLLEQKNAMIFRRNSNNSVGSKMRFFICTPLAKQKALQKMERPRVLHIFLQS